jgi:hypothetical protein
MALKFASDSTETSNPTVQLLVTEAQIKKEELYFCQKLEKIAENARNRCDRV